MATLRNQNEPGGVRDALRLALNDATLDLAYRRAGADEYLSVNGEPYTLPSPSDHRAVTPIERDGAVVAALVHDPFLLDDRDLIDAVCAAAGLSLANERLQADLRAQIQEVGASQRRLQDVLENVQLLAVSIDQDGRIRFCNQHLAEVVPAGRARNCWARSGWSGSRAATRTSSIASGRTGSLFTTRRC